MERWIKRLYICVLKDKRKVSELVISPRSGFAFAVIKEPNDISVQKWIDKLQDNK